MRAPIGYNDQGKGKPKTIDPIQGPLVRRAFEIYGSGRYCLETLGDEMFRLGLRNKKWRPCDPEWFFVAFEQPFLYWNHANLQNE